ncbi:hypothetical protein QQP08_000968 [Theobroma cacao]|nr:hypothetical protein QQP08_000968 [Theobroma cacao]
MTWKRLLVQIAWFISAVRLAHFVKNTESSRTVALIWELDVILESGEERLTTAGWQANMDRQGRGITVAPVVGRMAR